MSRRLYALLVPVVLLLQGCVCSIVEDRVFLQTLIADGRINNIERIRGADKSLDTLTKEELRLLCLSLIQVAYDDRKTYYLLLHLLNDTPMPVTDPPEGWAWPKRGK